MKKIITSIILVVMTLFVLSSTCFAKNFDIRFSLAPNGPSKYSGLGFKIDTDTKCYITTTGGSVITNGYTYKMRGKVMGWNGNTPTYTSATTLGTYSGKITSKTLTYIDPYYTNIQNGNYSTYDFILAASLHGGGTAGSYTIDGKWNP